ncbi:leucine--tRNA ligase [Pseudoduganella buxea]|uniref:Leucine--tRNA ligase n=2 Tax=Pseudoduganella buxea TaxID=1949069 RepID=A0A6I3SUJ9_9BURK|nr:class I tRNA ligase family protein [Pseudoduganella buxea]MTV52841.1 leucine--tRNA ligase [Pseudoduganella buxea]
MHSDHDRRFEPHRFERKWQQEWEQKKIHRADGSGGKPTCFVMDMFPYPSGSSMHVGHPRGYVATDVYSRFKRMQGFDVLHPMGWDAFGLPAEETAIANNEHPAATVARNIDRFRAQLTMLGLGYDWSREINTTDPGYYRHTQQIFLEFFRRGLARNDVVAVNWCPALGTVLANEDIVDGKSERGGHPVFQTPMRQWVLAITAYADRLLDDLDLLPQWPDRVKNAQRSWIGRSEGHELRFATSAQVAVDVFTTRIETLFGVTFLALAPDAELARSLKASASNEAEADAYIARAAQASELDRQSASSGAVLLGGVHAIHPLTKARLPVVIADYVLASYGTGAVMGVPAHDERDAQLARALDLPVLAVLDGDLLTNSGSFDGQPVQQARSGIAAAVAATGRKRYKIRDWTFSRQRFWGEPFPIVWIAGRDNFHAVAHGELAQWLPEQPISHVLDGVEYFAVPVLPAYLDAMRLPVVVAYRPTGTLEGPLAGIDQWVNAFIDPATGQVDNTPGHAGWIPVRRETNTMPQWAGSSWYWLRYMDPDNDTAPFSREAMRRWGQVDVYAGADHAVAHLIYARFWHKVMYDAGMVDFAEPFKRLEFLGHILAADGSKISKRSGNSRSPEEVVREVGADAFRLYEMFIGPFEKAIPWSDEGLTGTRRFLERVWSVAHRVIDENAPASATDALKALHRTVDKVGDDIEKFRFNTAVATLMGCLNEVQHRTLSVSDFSLFLLSLAPFAPHMTEEIWSTISPRESIHLAPWPQADAALLQDELITLPVQVNGKLRGNVVVKRDIPEADLRTVSLNHADVSTYVSEHTLKKFIYVPGRIVNLVT